MVPVTPSVAEVVIALQIKARVKQRGSGQAPGQDSRRQEQCSGAEVSRGLAMSLAAHVIYIVESRFQRDVARSPCQAAAARTEVQVHEAKVMSLGGAFRQGAEAEEAQA